MERIDSEMAAQVWRRVLAGREYLGGIGEEGVSRKAYSGDLPPVRTTPPGLAGWNTYAVFPEPKSRPARKPTLSPTPLPILLLLLAVMFGKNTKLQPQTREKAPLTSISAR